MSLGFVKRLKKGFYDLKHGQSHGVECIAWAFRDNAERV